MKSIFLFALFAVIVLVVVGLLLVYVHFQSKVSHNTRQGHGAASLMRNWHVMGLFPDSEMIFARTPPLQDPAPGQPLPVVLRACQKLSWLSWLSHLVAMVSNGAIQFVRQFTIVIHGLPNELRHVLDGRVDAVGLMDVLDGHTEPGPWTLQHHAGSLRELMFVETWTLETWTLTVTCAHAR